MDFDLVKVKDISIGIFDGPHATPKEAIEGPIFLGIGDIKPEGGIEISNATSISEEDYLVWTRRVTPQVNDIVFSYEATLHRYAIIPENLKCCLGRRLALIRVDNLKADYKFIYYTFFSSAWRNQVNGRIISGATVERISLIDFPNYKIKLPSLPIQRRIAEILGRYDALIENYSAQIRTLEALAQNLYREWFIRFRISDFGFRIDENTKLPVGWEKKKFTEVVSILSGGTPKTDNPNYWNGDVFWFSPADLQNSFYVMSTGKTITETGLKNCNSKLYPKNTVVITARGTVGKCVLLGAPMAINQSNYALVGKNISQFFVYLKSLELTSKWKQEAIGAVFETITVDNFERTEIILPSNDILLKFEKIVTPIFAKMENLQNQITKLRQMRDKLLPRLLSGNIEFKV